MKKITIITTMILIFLQIFISQTYAIQPDGNEIFEGIDVSRWQGNIDFSKVANDGIKIVYIKATQGVGYVSPTFETSYKSAKENGLKVGVYHYVTARSVEQAEKEADFFASKISGKEIDCKLAMDFETFGNLSKTQINRIALEYIKEVERLSKKEVVVYSNTYTATNIFDKKVAKYPLWVAQYGVSSPQDNGNWGNWVGYQYSSSGRVNGINGNVDLDRYTEDIFLSTREEIPEVENPKCDYEDRIKYKIKPGDTLSEIALKYSTTVSHLARINNIKNPNLIYAGEIIIISHNHNNCNNQKIYTIQFGDTLSEIALRYNTTVSKLVRINNIANPDLIYAGEELRIN